MTEKQWQGLILDFAHTYGWVSYHTFDSRRSAAGFPDLVLVRDDRCLFVELKAQRGLVSADQQRWLALLKQVAAANRTVEVHCWRPSDETEAFATLSRGPLRQAR